MKLLFMLVGSALLTIGVSVALAATSASYPPPSTETANGLFIVNCPFSHRKQVDPSSTRARPGLPRATCTTSSEIARSTRTPRTRRRTAATTAPSRVTGPAIGSDAGRAERFVRDAEESARLLPEQAREVRNDRGLPTGFPSDRGRGGDGPARGMELRAGREEPRRHPPSCGSALLVLHVKFPNCWNGVSTDSANHRSHVTYPTSSNACPSTHPVKVPEIFLHVRYPPGVSGPATSSLTAPRCRTRTSGTRGSNPSSSNS